MFTVLYGVNNATKNYFDDHLNTEQMLVVTTDGEEKFRGEKTLSLIDLSEMDFNDIEKIVICSSFVGEISSSLDGIGFPLDRVYCFDTFNVGLSSCADIKRSQIKKEDVLYAFYDLANNWVTFDCIAFCTQAELERKRLGKKYIHFLIVPDHSSLGDYVGAFHCQTPEDRSWRVDHILKSVMSCIPSALGVSRLAFREEADFFVSSGIDCFPSDYNSADRPRHFSHNELLIPIGKGASIGVFEAPLQARQLVQQYLEKNAKGKKAIVVNLREYGIQAGRNSLLEDWSRFLNELDKDEYYPIIVRDFYKATEKLPSAFDGMETFPAASIDFAIRVALYEAAYVNLSRTNGAFYITNFLKDVASVTFVEVDDNNPCMSTETWGKSGYVVGQDAVIRSNKNQIIHWGVDDYQSIKSSFEKLITQLEK